MGLDLVSFLEKTNIQYGITRSPIRKVEVEEKEKETILDTFPEPFDDHEEKLLKERDEVKKGEIMLITKKEKEE